VPALIRKHCGEYVLRGGKFVVLEGAWNPARPVILRFPDLASVQAFFLDSGYQPLKTLRQQVPTADIVAVEGVL
jgi:uncharacterized protein (DUF1330 family)